MGKYVVEGMFILGSNIGDKVCIPQLFFIPSDVIIPFKFQQRQFQLVVSFVMTINKSQVQSLKNIWVYISSSIFSYSQFYMAISKVISWGGLKLLITDEDSQYTNSTSNVLYKEVFLICDINNVNIMKTYVLYFLYTVNIILSTFTLIYLNQIYTFRTKQVCCMGKII